LNQTLLDFLADDMAIDFYLLGTLMRDRDLQQCEEQPDYYNMAGWVCDVKDKITIVVHSK